MSRATRRVRDSLKSISPVIRRPMSTASSAASIDTVAFAEKVLTLLEDGKEETVNKASALWMRSKSDITPEQYEEFVQRYGRSC